jgi:hypothetical protein
MGVLSIMMDAIALMIGSLLCAGMLTFAAWWVADRIHRPWVALIMLASVCAALLISPLEHSLFVRMLAVFGIVGTGLLYFMGDDEGNTMTPATAAKDRKPQHGHARRP